MMDHKRTPLYSGPMFPVPPGSQPHHPTHRLRGTIVGVRAGRAGEEDTTRLLTIKLSESHTGASLLLHAEVELIVTPTL